MSTTPILDLIAAPPKAKSSKWFIVLCVAIGLTIGFWNSLTDVELPVPGFNGLLWIPAIYIMISIHELGHLAAAKMTGMAPGGLVIGGFSMLRAGAGWKFRFQWKNILGGGLAVPLPGNEKFDRAGYVWMIAGGPLASIVSTVACWLAWMKYGDGEWSWIGSCFWAAALGLLSLIPMSSGIHKSDAGRLWSFWKRPEESRAWMAIVAVQAENFRGIRPRDWDATLVEQMLAVPQPRSGPILPELMAYYRCADEGNEMLGLEHLERALAASRGAGKVLRQALYFEASSANAMLKHNIPNAIEWRERGLKLRKPESRASVDGAIAMREGRFEDALREIASARAFLIKRGGDMGMARFAQEILDKRELQCREALSSDRATASVSG